LNHLQTADHDQKKLFEESGVVEMSMQEQMSRNISIDISSGSGAKSLPFGLSLDRDVKMNKLNQNKTQRDIKYLFMIDEYILHKKYE